MIIMTEKEKQIIAIERLLYNYDLQEIIKQIKHQKHFFLHNESSDELYTYEKSIFLSVYTYWLIKDLEKLLIL